MCSLRYGHPVQDNAILAMIEDIWWRGPHSPRCDRPGTVVELCLESGKKLKYMLKEKQTGKVPEVKEQNEEVSIYFAGPFQNAKKGKKY